MYGATSFCENGKCIKCSLFIALEVRLSKLEAQFHQLDQSPVGLVASQANVAVDQPRVSAASVMVVIVNMIKS